jgi:hypothetical protein
MTTTAPFLTDRLTITLDGMRAAMAAEGARKGLAGALLAAILGFLDTLVALLAEFLAGTLAALAPSPRAACPIVPRGAGPGIAAAEETPAAALPDVGDAGVAGGAAATEARAQTRIAPPPACAAGGCIQATGLPKRARVRRTGTSPRPPGSSPRASLPQSGEGEAHPHSDWSALRPVPPQGGRERTAPALVRVRRPGLRRRPRARPVAASRLQGIEFKKRSRR